MNRRSAIVAVVGGFLGVLWCRLGLSSFETKSRLVEGPEVIDKWNRRITKTFAGTDIPEAEAFAIIQQMQRTGWSLEKIDCRRVYRYQQIGNDQWGWVRLNKTTPRNCYMIVELVFWKPSSPESRKAIA